MTSLQRRLLKWCILNINALSVSTNAVDAQNQGFCIVFGVVDAQYW